uniref:hypothetical protein n=1 Tax=Arthrobacter sp. E3 TaxID=517402 RepID=UPI001A953208
MNTFDGGEPAELLVEGLYELLHTDDLGNRLQLVPELQQELIQVDKEISPDVLARHVADAVRELLNGTKAEERVAKTNQILNVIDLERVGKVVILPFRAAKEGGRLAVRDAWPSARSWTTSPSPRHG